MTQPLRVLVVGYGPVGARFVENVLPAVRDGRMALTVVGAEADDAYNRVLVAEYAVGWHGPRFPDDRRPRGGGRRGRADPHRRVGRGTSTARRRTAVLSTGETVAYDRVVLATGSRANTPTLAGVPARSATWRCCHRFPAS